MIYIALIVLILLPLTFSASFAGTFASGSTFDDYTYTTTTSSNYVVASLNLLPEKSQAVLIIRSTPLIPSSDASEWQHVNPKSTTQFDYDGLVVGRSQYAWISNPGIGFTIYIYVVNLQASRTPTYAALVSESSTISRTCTSGASSSTSNFYCVSCPQGLAGVYCSIGQTKMSQGDKRTLDLDAGEYTLVTLQTEGDASVSIQTGAGGITAYFQYIQHLNELSGLTNHIGVYDFNLKNEYVADFQNGHKFVGIGLMNANSQVVRVYVEYLDGSSFSVIMVIVCVIGGLIFMGILITIAVVWRKKAEERLVHPFPINLQGVHWRDSSKLSTSETNLYFPAVLKSEVFPKGSSMASLNKLRSQEEDGEQLDQECVICLSPIKSDELIRAGYCKHIFHSHCLELWFKKQQNCPYCRQDFSKKTTVGLHARLAQGNQKQARGLEIVVAIFQPKLDATLKTLWTEDIEENIS